MGKIVRYIRIDDSPIVIGTPKDPQSGYPPDAHEDLEDPLASARIQREAILEEAHREAAEIRKLAYAEGFNTGLEQGRAEAEAEARFHLQALRAALAELQSVKARILSDAAPQLVSLALAVAESILHYKIDVDPATVTHILKAAIHQVHSRDILRITVNPRDYEFILRYWREFHDPDFRDHGLEITADEEVSPGGVIVHTTFGRIDGRIDVQLEEVREAFQKWKERKESDI